MSITHPDDSSPREPNFPPVCQEHDRAALELALGLLDGERAVAADQASRECPVCRSWWESTLEREAAMVVDHAVAEAFSNFKAPAHGRSRSHPGRRWLAVAAVFLATVLTLVLAPRTLQDREGAGQTIAQEKILTEDFEFRGDAPKDFALVGGTSTAAEAHETAEAIFAGDFESGDLVVWSPEG